MELESRLGWQRTALGPQCTNAHWLAFCAVLLRKGHTTNGATRMGAHSDCAESELIARASGREFPTRICYSRFSTSINAIAPAGARTLPSWMT